MGFGMLWFGREQGVGLAEKRRGEVWSIAVENQASGRGDMFDFEV